MVGNVSVNVFEPPEFYAWEKGNDRFSINTYENFQILGKFKRFQAKILYCKVRFYKLMLLCCWQVAKKNWKIITKCLHFPSCHQAVKITHLKNSFCFSISYLLYVANHRALKMEKFQIFLEGRLPKIPPFLRFYSTVIVLSLFRNKEFLVNLKTERYASKFAMFMEKENPRSFFRFSFRATFIFPL